MEVGVESLMREEKWRVRGVIWMSKERVRVAGWIGEPEERGTVGSES